MADGRFSALSNASGNSHATPAEIRDQLARILNSQEFRSSHRSKDFLKYVVENTLEGRGETLKERTIGIDVFARPASYDPADDATVRVKAGEVRKRLDRYYTLEGHADRVRIELPAGTYTPEFRVVTAADAPAGALHAVGAPRPPRKWIYFVIALLLVAAVAVFLIVRPARTETAVDQFWKPVFEGSAPVLITAAFVPVYFLNQPAGAPASPRADQFVLLNDQFVGGGDLVAATRIIGLLARTGHPWQVKIGADVSFADLRNSPTVLIGYSYTRWKEISREMRYFIDADQVPRMVSDFGKPTRWALPNLPADRRTDEDYAIVSRVFHPETRAMLVEISGITQYGTSAGAELVTRPDLLAEALHNAPPDWKRKNLQLVLHVRVISGTPASPRVVASYFW